MDPNLEWSDPLEPWMIEALHSLGFMQMTPVQAAVIPLLSKNKDVVAEAVTGSGKTLAFLIPLLLRLSKINEKLERGQTNAIVVEPTRELAYQTHRVLTDLLSLAPSNIKYRVQLVTGGDKTSKTEDFHTYMQLKPHIVIATPGRLYDLVGRAQVRLNSLDLLVFDEGDRLLDLQNTLIPSILNLLPKQKRCALFSATMNHDLLSDIVKMGMRNPVKIKVNNSGAVPEKLQLRYFNYGEPCRKIPFALHLLKTTNFSKCIVYIPTCTSVNFWYQIFKLFLDFKVFSMHGKIPLTPRLKTLSKFGEFMDKCVLLTTDVAARGLDIQGVDYVLQLDPPVDPNMFVHRAGRTGRADASGLCDVLLNDGLELGYVDLLKVRGVHLTMGVSENVDIDVNEYIKTVQTFTKRDRAHHDLALRSFLSFVRYYMKHTATSIFRLQNLDLVEIARGFGVLKMPRMPELKNTDLSNDGFLTEKFDIENDLVYLDPKQELARQNKLKKRALGPTQQELERINQKRKNATAWSGKLDRKATAQNRREKKLKRAIHKKEESDDDVEEDWKEVVKERKKRKSEVLSFDL